MAAPFLAAAQLAAPFIRAALPALINAVPTLGRIFGSGSDVSERNIAAAQIALDIGKQAVGAVNEQQLVEALEDGEKAAAVKNAVEAQYLQIEVATERSIGAARVADVAFITSGAKLWQSPAFIISCILLVFVLLLLVDFLFVHPTLYDNSARTQINTAVLGILLLVGGYHLGSSVGSARKTEIAAGAPPVNLG